MKMMVMMMMMTVMIAAGAGSSKALKGLLKALKELFEGTHMALRRHSKDSSKTLRFSEGTQRVLRKKHKTQDRNSKPAAATRSQIQLLEKKLNAHQ